MKTGKRISLKNLIYWTSAENLTPANTSGNAAACINAISIDSRTIEENDFFIPIKGEHFDGHDFILEAIKKGCCGFVFQENFNNKLDSALKDFDSNMLKKLLILRTADNISFLLKLAAGYIRDFPVIVIGITGSAGKTTTKEFIVNILSGDFNIVFTPENYNTELGISMAVLQINEKTQFFIAEMGMRANGQIRRLSEVININMGAITSVGASHLEFFNDVSEIALAKAEMAEVIAQNNGVLLLNRDDEWTEYIIDSIKNKNPVLNLQEFGRNNNLDFNFKEKQADNLGRYSFDLFKKEEKLAEINMPVAGFHNIYNACCAAALCSGLGIPVETIKNGIQKSVPESSRMRVFIKSGITVIDDCYNASPLSMKRAIDTLSCISGSKKSRSVAVLADMMELGKNSGKLHFEIGQYLRENNINVLIAYGKLAKDICRGFKHEGKKSNEKDKNQLIYHFEDMKNMCSRLSKILKNGDVVLIKGSRANKLEKVLDYI